MASSSSILLGRVSQASSGESRRSAKMAGMPYFYSPGRGLSRNTGRVVAGDDAWQKRIGRGHASAALPSAATARSTRRWLPAPRRGSLELDAEHRREPVVGDGPPATPRGGGRAGQPGGGARDEVGVGDAAQREQQLG